MPNLTQQDLQAIKGVVTEVLEPFATAIQGDFKDLKGDSNDLKKDLTDFRIEANEKFHKIKDDVSYIHGSLEVIQREIAEIKKKLDNIVYRHELEAVRGRITVIENKLGI